MAIFGLLLALGSGNAESIAVLPTVLDAAAQAQVPSRMDEVILQAVQEAGYEAVGYDDISTMLGYEADKQLLGCDDNSECIAEILGAMDVDQTIVFSVEAIDGRWLVTAKLLDPNQGRVIARSNRIFDGAAEQVLAAVGPMVGELLGVTLELSGPQTVVAITDADASRFNVSFDIGGTMAYGPSLQVEYGERFGFSGRVRALSLGLANILGAADSVQDESMSIGFAVGLGARRYLDPVANLRGIYVGVAAEYWFTEIVDRDFDQEAYVNQGLLLMAEGGYRFPV
ncbi:MAG: hypothetical protein AAFX94_04345, partial [Myxococcota bacterium]